MSNDTLTDDEIEAAIDHSGAADLYDVADVREAWDDLQASIASAWDEYADGLEHGEEELVTETDEALLIDANIVDLNPVHVEIKESLQLEHLDDEQGELTSILTQLMHEVAADMGRSKWPTTYPLVVEKREGVTAPEVAR